MKLTLRECLSFGGLTDAKVLAGESNIDREVLNVSILEIAHPLVSQWVSHHELYISSFYNIHDNPSAQEQVVIALANCGCTGLIIGHLGHWFEAVSQGLIDLCNNLNFPLIAANPEINYLSIMNPIFKRLMGWKPQEIGFLDLRKDIIEIALQENNLVESLKKISLVTNTLMSAFDRKYRWIYSNKTEIEIGQEAQLLNMKVHEDSNYFVHGYAIDYCFGIQKLIIPTLGDMDRLSQGFIVLNIEDHSLKNLLKLVDSFRIAYSILLSKKSLSAETRSEYRQEYWTHLISWDFQSEKAAIKMGLRCGVDMTKIHHLIVIKYYGSQCEKNPETINIDSTILKWLINRSKAMSDNLSENNFQIVDEDCIIHLLGDCQIDPDYNRLAQKFLKLFSDHKVGSVIIGISRRFQQLKEIPLTYQQTLDAINIGRMVHYNTSIIIRYKDIWFLDYLHKLRQNESAVGMSKITLQPLLDNNENDKSDLLKTLKVLIEKNNNISETAKIMNVHRNTIVYRRKIITEMLGEDPFQHSSQFKYYAALVILRSGEERN
jgi:sugar diacid utilization regulator